MTRPNALAKAVAETLVIDARTVEIYELLASSEGIKVGFTVHAADSNGNHHLDYLLQRRHRKKLELLILKHWSLHRLPKCMMIHQGHRGTTTTNTEEGMSPNTVSNSDPKNAPKLNPGLGRNSSNFKVIQLHHMNTERRLNVRSYDPQLNGLDSVDENVEIPVSPSSTWTIAMEEGTDWTKFVEDLQEYAQSLSMIQENVETQIKENMNRVDMNELVVNEAGEGNLTADELCAAYMQNIYDLLEEKANLSQQGGHRSLQSWNSVATISGNYSQDTLEWPQ